MDPYDEYMKEREDWQNEISKRDDELTKLRTIERGTFNLYMKSNETAMKLGAENDELKLELRKRWEIIEKMGEALKWYANKDNIEDRIKEVGRWSAGEWITHTSMYDDVTKIAEDALNEPR